MDLQIVPFNELIDVVTTDKELLVEVMTTYGYTEHPRLKGRYSCPKCGSKDNVSIHKDKTTGHYKMKCFAECSGHWDCINIVAENTSSNNFREHLNAVASLKGMKCEGFGKLTNIEASEISRYKKQNEQYKEQYLKDIENKVDTKVDEILSEDLSQLDAEQRLLDLNKRTEEITKLSDSMLGLSNGRLREDLNMDKPKGWLIEGLVYENSIGFIIAPPKCGKTSFAYLMAKALSEGKPFMGHNVDKAIPTLYILQDGTLANIRKRFNQTVDHYYMTDAKGLTWTNLKPQLIRTVKTYGIKFVVLDSFYRILGGDMTKGEVVLPMLEELDKLSTELGCTFTFVHHTNRDNTSTNSRNKVAGSDHINKVSEFRIMLEPTMNEDERLQMQLESEDDYIRQEFTVLKSDYRHGGEGLIKYSCSINDDTKELESTKFTLAMGQRANSGQDRIIDLFQKCIEIIPTMETFNKSKLVDLLYPLGVGEKSTIDKNLKQVLPMLVDNGMLKRHGQAYKLSKPNK